jgi:HPt (histidine-containing phosphotransfer) domain-containing protein
MGQAHKLSDMASCSRSDCVALDIASLNQNTFGDRQLRAEILGLFGAQVDSTLRSLSLPIDQEGWVFLTHTLKGAAAAIGAVEISNLASNWSRIAVPKTDLERLALADDLRNAQAHLKEVLVALAA